MEVKIIKSIQYDCGDYRLGYLKEDTIEKLKKSGNLQTAKKLEKMSLEKFVKILKDKSGVTMFGPQTDEEFIFYAASDVIVDTWCNDDADIFVKD